MSLFDVAGMKYFIPRSFFEKNDLNFFIETFPFILEKALQDRPRTASPNTIIERVVPFLFSICQNTSIKPNFYKPNTKQTLNFPLKTQKTLLLNTEKKESLITDIVQSRFLSKLKRSFLSRSC